MKVVCPQCSTGYNISDQKVPPPGTCVNCVKCGHVMTIAKEAPAVPSGQPSLPTSPAQLARGISAIRAQSGVSRAQTTEEEIYSVRTAKGLVVDFQTHEALTTWLKKRDDLSSFQIQKKGQGWRPAQDFLGLKGPNEQAQPESTQPHPPMPALNSGGVQERLLGIHGSSTNGSRQPEKAGPIYLTSVAAGFLLVLVVLAATMTRYGWIDMSSVLPLHWLGIQFPRNQQTKVETPLPPVNREDDIKRFHEAMDKGQNYLQSKRFSSAALEFNRALGIRSEEPAALEGLARSYEGLGDAERARPVWEKLKKARAFPKSKTEKGKGNGY